MPGTGGVVDGNVPMKAIQSQRCRGGPMCPPEYTQWMYVGQTHRSAPTGYVIFSLNEYQAPLHLSKEGIRDNYCATPNTG